MSYSPTEIRKAIGPSVLIGAFSGVCLQLVLTAWYEPIKSSEIWVIPVLIAAYGLLAVPFVGLGLAIFVVPLTHLFRPHANRIWVGLVAIIWGAVAGKIVYYVIDHVLFFGLYHFSTIGRVDMGLIYGIPTGVAWWLLKRRAFAVE